MAEKKDTEQRRYRALAFVKGESLAKEKDSRVSEDELPTWPYLVRKEFLAAIIVTIILLVWSIALNAPLEDPSDPSVTPDWRWEQPKTIALIPKLQTLASIDRRCAAADSYHTVP